MAAEHKVRYSLPTAIDRLSDRVKELSLRSPETVAINRIAKRNAAAAVRARTQPPVPKHAMRVSNYVVSARIVRVGNESFTSGFHFPWMVDVLGGQYTECGFARVIIHQRRPEVCSHLYHTGRIIACGAKDEIDAIWSMHNVMRRIRLTLGWQLRLVHYKVSNVVCHRNMGIHLNLWAMYDDKSLATVYDPTLFPGLALFPRGFSETTPCVIVHASGAILVVGAEHFDVACRATVAIDWNKYRLCGVGECRHCDRTRQ